MKQPKDFFNKQAYANLLKTNDWKNFSIRVRDRVGNFCQMCKRSDVVLNVHHWFCDATRQPWEYKDNEVIVVCEGCHGQIHVELQNFRKYVFSKFTPTTLKVLNGALAVGLDNYEPLVLVHAIAELVGTPSMVERYAKAWGVSSSKRSEEQKAFDKFKRSLKGTDIPQGPPKQP